MTLIEKHGISLNLYQDVQRCTAWRFQLASYEVSGTGLITSEAWGPQNSQQGGLREEQISQRGQLFVIYNLNKPL